jgi:soluble lytic murein transglycosylase-like protein
MGYAKGITESEGLANSATQRMMGSVLAKARARANLEALINREPDFLPKLTGMAQARGIDPNHLLNVMALETAQTFNPVITNPLGYTGLIQIGKAAAKDLGTTTGAIRQMSATEQLDFVFKYLDQHAHDA